MSESLVLSEILGPFAECLDSESAQRVIEFGFSPGVQNRVAALAEKANEGLLSDDERQEYEAIINANDFISILKVKARGIIASQPH